ncbi:MAG: V-type ATP synthase subunit E, partial [Actinomycetia bacterium]|nr:V-type ATP synthase subunit E [Actinomycetes bacterium]
RDAQAEYEKIIINAKETALEIVDQAKRKAEAYSNNMSEKSQQEHTRLLRENVATARLKARDKVVGTKQRLIDEAFKKAEVLLGKMDDQEYAQLVAGRLAKESSDGGDVVLDQAFESLNGQIVKEANDLLKKSGRKPVKLSTEKRNIGRGFILAHEKIEQNYVFSRLFKVARDTYETAVAKTIFEGQE